MKLLRFSIATKVLSMSVFGMTGAWAQEGIALPSGLEASLQEVLIEEGLGRFRFVVPGIGPEGMTYMEMREDLPWLCENLIVPALDSSGQSVSDVVVSVADRPVTFGEITPEATQFFEVFSLENGTCMREDF